jgi:FkbM family methyltransferase
MTLPPAYEAVQLEAERRLHQYLHIDASQIRKVIIVGTHDGAEIPRLRLAYPQSSYLCFEASPHWHAVLLKKFGNQPWFECRNIAVTDQVGAATFHELPMPGNGSILPPNPQRWAEFNLQTEHDVHSYRVNCSTLDEETVDGGTVDLLWVDVQGAEGKVLAGATSILERTSALLLEVSLVESPYCGAVLFSELNAILETRGFRCVSLGCDPWNFSGNALWVRKITDRVCATSGAFNF